MLLCIRKWYLRAGRQNAHERLDAGTELAPAGDSQEKYKDYIDDDGGNSDADDETDY